MTEITMYWITRLDGIRSLLGELDFLFGAMAILGGLAWTIAAVIRKANEHYNRDGYVDMDWSAANLVANTARKFAIWGVVISAAFSAAKVFVPTTREMAAIKIVPAIASPEMCEKIKDVSKDLVDAAAEWLKDVKECNKERRQ